MNEPLIRAPDEARVFRYEATNLPLTMVIVYFVAFSSVTLPQKCHNRKTEETNSGARERTQGKRRTT